VDETVAVASTRRGDVLRFDVFVFRFARLVRGDLVADCTAIAPTPGTFDRFFPVCEIPVVMIEVLAGVFVVAVTVVVF
jgi:hypothetical protein